MTEEFKAKFSANTKFRTGERINAGEIIAQFVKTQSRYFLTVGEIDCPTGFVLAADPLAYLPSGQFSPVLAEKLPEGKYPVKVSIFRNEEIGLRMCTACLVINDKQPVEYVRATATTDSVIRLREEAMEGFPVDAGMMCFCDKQTAEEYRAFLDRWYEKNPKGNHYDDYFAAFFAESYEKLPAYQRPGGDFIEWTNPDTGSRMVMIASGFGDGFYNCYYGLDKDNAVCQIIVPMVNPDIFE